MPKALSLKTPFYSLKNLQFSDPPLDTAAPLAGTNFDQFIVVGALELHQTFNQNSIYVQFQNLLDASIAIQALTNPLLAVLGVFMGWVN